MPVGPKVPRLTSRGNVIPCRCRERHRPDDPRIRTALDPDTYDGTGAGLWQAHAGMLWAQFVLGWGPRAQIEDDAGEISDALDVRRWRTAGTSAPSRSATR